MRLPTELRAPFSAGRVSHILIAICALVWLICALNPHDFETWLLEQFAPLCALLVLVCCVWQHVHFSTAAKISIATIFVVHTIGTHFTYSLTPYDQFLHRLTGVSLNELGGWQRNHYDRFVHLMYGICMALPTAEVLTQRLHMRPLTAQFFAFQLILSTSALYELLEWAAALVFGDELGILYLGTQGDVWDSHADMALAGAGLLGVYALTALFAVCGRRYPS